MYQDEEWNYETQQYEKTQSAKDREIIENPGNYKKSEKVDALCRLMVQILGSSTETKEDDRVDNLSDDVRKIKKQLGMD